MKKMLIKNGLLVDPSQGLHEKLDLLIEGDRVLKIDSAISVSASTEVIDASHQIVSPGFIDLHTHLREPGQEYKEDIATGTRAAVQGGFTSVCCMANTVPVNDSKIVTEYILSRAQKTASTHVFPIGALTQNLDGKTIAPIAELKQAGCVALSDDGRTVQNAAVMRQALAYAKSFDLPVVSHCLCADLMGKGVMHEGWMATKLGLKGIPREAEDHIVFRDTLLSGLTGAALHIAHLSTAGSVEIVRKAKLKGWPVTAEVTPHHFSLTDQFCETYDTNTKMAPPLRTLEDIQAIKAALADGTIDAIATDHAPHAVHEKELGFDEAPFGMIGLETALPLSLNLVREGCFSISRLVELLSVSPARIFHLDRGTLQVGSIADLVLFDPNETWIYDTTQGASKSRNSPFQGQKMQGKVKSVVVAGKRVF